MRRMGSLKASSPAWPAQRLCSQEEGMRRCKEMTSPPHMHRLGENARRERSYCRTTQKKKESHPLQLRAQIREGDEIPIIYGPTPAVEGVVLPHAHHL